MLCSMSRVREENSATRGVSSSTLYPIVKPCWSTVAVSDFGVDYRAPFSSPVRQGRFQWDPIPTIDVFVLLAMWSVAVLVGSSSWSVDDCRSLESVGTGHVGV